MKNSALASLLVAIGLVSACSATGDGGVGPGLRGMFVGDTGGSGAALTGGTGNVLGGSGGTGSSGTGGKSSGGTAGTGGKFGTGGAVGGNAGGSGGNPAGGSGSGGSPLSGGTTGAGGVVTGTGGAATGGSVGSAGGAAPVQTGGSVGASGGTPGSGGSGNAIGGLIGHWKFDDISGPTAVDSSGRNHSLTISGDATLDMTDKTGKGLKLGGAGVASATFSLGTLNAMTVGLWVKSTSGNYDPAVMLFEFGASSLIWDATAVSWTVLEEDAGGTAPPPDEWHHLGASWDTGTSVEFCLDGVSVQSGTGSVATISGSKKLSIGKLAADTDGFNGVIDDVRIYDRALSCTEIFAAAQ